MSKKLNLNVTIDTEFPPTLVEGDKSKFVTFKGTIVPSLKKGEAEKAEKPRSITFRAFDNSDNADPKKAETSKKNIEKLLAKKPGEQVKIFGVENNWSAGDKSGRFIRVWGVDTKKEVTKDAPAPAANEPVAEKTAKAAKAPKTPKEPKAPKVEKAEKAPAAPKTDKPAKAEKAPAEKKPRASKKAKEVETPAAEAPTATETPAAEAPAEVATVSEAELVAPPKPEVKKVIEDPGMNM